LGERDRSRRDIVEKTISRREESTFFDSGVDIKDEKQAHFGGKKPWARFLYKLINEADN
jgi:hypothetical protein